MVLESKFPTKLPFRLARSICTERGCWGSTQIITQQRWGHMEGSISTVLRLVESVYQWLHVSQETRGIPGTVFPPGSTSRNFSFLLKHLTFALTLGVPRSHPKIHRFSSGGLPAPLVAMVSSLPDFLLSLFLDACPHPQMCTGGRWH